MRTAAGHLTRSQPAAPNAAARVFAMPKMKTNKAVAKRVRVTAKGKLKRGRPLGRHLKSSKSPKRKRALRKSRTVSRGFAKHAKALLGL